MSLILAIDTSTNIASIALCSGSKILKSSQDKEPNTQASRLLPSIQKLLSDAGVDFADLDRIACTLGPGSFTGIRVGLAAAKGLELALGIPLIGISTFKVMSEPDSCVVIKANMDNVYVQEFSGGTEDGDAKFMKIDEVKTDKKIITNSNLVAEKFGVEITLPDAKNLALLAADFEGAPTSDPIYVNPPNVKKAK